MIAYRIRCDSCGHRLKYGDEHVGRTARCQKCQASFRIPPPDTAGGSEVRPAAAPEPEAASDTDIRTRCPHCAAAYEIASRYVSTSVTCRECNQPFRIEVDHAGRLKELKRELDRQVRAAALATSPTLKGVYLADMMDTLARIGDVAAAAAPDDPEGARAAATSTALAEANARIDRVRGQRAWSDAREMVGSSVLCFLGGLSIVVLVGLVALLADVLFWGIGIIGLIMIVGGGAGALLGSVAAIDAFSRRHRLLRAVTKGLGYTLLAVVLFGALVFAGSAVLGFF